MMQEKHPDYQLLGDNMQLVDSVTIIVDGDKKYKIEVVEIIHERKNKLLMYELLDAHLL